ncbi:MAG TPA: EAL domain-containing protein [Gammaproteobacteria bacterium]|nr:EAL domain-containing protein [Gammaproteobacteria bacterium]
MLEHLTRQRKSLTALICLTFLLSPLFSLWGAVVFGLVDWHEVVQVLKFGPLPAFLAIMLTLVAVYFWRFLNPLARQLGNDPYNISLAEVLRRRVTTYGVVYWGLFIFYSICQPAIYLYSAQKTGIIATATFGWNFVALQLTISILIGVPAYLLILDRLSQLARFTGVVKAQNRVYSKLLLLAGFLPILAYSLLLEYHWQKTGQLETSALVIWVVLTTVTAIIALLSANSLRRSLAPVERALQSSGAVTNQSLADLHACSVDEMGMLSQALGKVFQRLTDQESHIHAIIDNAAEGIIVTNENGLIDTFNLAAQNLFNYSSQEVRGKPLSWLINGMLEKDGSPKHLSGRYKVSGIKRDGCAIPVAVCVSGVIHAGKPEFIYLVNDLTETEAAFEKIQKAKTLYSDLVETAHDLVWSMDTNGNWSFLNNASAGLYGYKPDEMVGLPVSNFRHPDYAEQEQQAFANIYEGHDLYQFETVHLDRRGKEITLSLNARAQTDTDGNIIRITGTARDITVTKEYQRQLSYQAEHDALTGLYNRRFFQQELERVIARVARSAETAGLLYIDLDQFKYINDTLGHAAGDRLLIEISKLLSYHAREGDLLARFGGDEFTLLLYNIEAGNLEIVAENFRKHFDEYHFHDNGKGFNISCSIGATLLGEDIKTSEEAMSQADLACNIAKTRGRNCVNIYRPEDHDEEGMAEDMGWAARVKDMIENDRFILAYQPIVNTGTGETAAHEILLRMPTDDGQIILPGGFMPAAERFGLVHSLDNWMIGAVIECLGKLHRQGVHAHFSINLSDRAVDYPGLVNNIHQRLSEADVPAEYLAFEISETAIITNYTAAVALITQIKELGCFCTLDNFGAGLCSLGYLKDLPVDTIKIAGAVIHGVASNPVDRAMVESINNIAHILGKGTVAECVENEKTLETLAELGVDFVQGHHLGHPVQELDHVREAVSLQQSITR